MLEMGLTLLEPLHYLVGDHLGKLLTLAELLLVRLVQCGVPDFYFLRVIAEQDPPGYVVVSVGEGEACGTDGGVVSKFGSPPSSWIFFATPLIQASRI
jgi:hypothetical protein